MGRAIATGRPRARHFFLRGRRLSGLFREGEWRRPCATDWVFRSLPYAGPGAPAVRRARRLSRSENPRRLSPRAGSGLRSRSAPTSRFAAMACWWRDIPCTEPISALPIAQYTDELVVVRGCAPSCTWSSPRPRLGAGPAALRLDEVPEAAGFNIDTSPGLELASCCATVARQVLFTLRSSPDDQREFDRTWSGIRGTSSSTPTRCGTVTASGTWNVAREPRASAAAIRTTTKQTCRPTASGTG